MSALIYFVFLVINAALTVIVWLVVANAVVSWLVAFDIVNLRNRAAYNAVKMLDRIVSPLLAPFRRFIPPLGGMDITPVLLIILIWAAQRALLPAALQWLESLVGGQVVT
jgi:YggT family protein